MGLGWREGAVTVSGLLVLASAFLPWWAVSVQVRDAGGTHVATYFGSAWQMSSRWTAAVLIVFGAAALWLVWRLVRGRVPGPVWAVLLAAVAIAVFLTLDQRDASGEWLSAPTIELSLGPDPDPAGSLAAAWMQRDDLNAYASDGLNIGLAWGFWTGFTAMILTGASLALAGPEGTRTPWRI
ncbi:hypothetical protein BJ973_007340 [Actinoplanes tereljensis]|uniref:Uncharacterized protein n=1 Tax=Paractinoplanes tereljensis TaxID=571912 RepID=A0A919TVQ3_9ACTN|nr:hypothetical protein [Actinoplanes tereljensis]GIF25083.1 hypothetical protein Ate02nite_78130 [Actinoplanes tereljensis]